MVSNTTRTVLVAVSAIWIVSLAGWGLLTGAGFTEPVITIGASDDAQPDLVIMTETHDTDVDGQPDVVKLVHNGGNDVAADRLNITVNGTAVTNTGVKGPDAMYSVGETLAVIDVEPGDHIEVAWRTSETASTVIHDYQVPALPTDTPA